MKAIKNLYRKIKAFFRLIIRKIDKKIIVPITKFVLMIGEKTGKNSKSFERWLTRKNTLVFLSLLLALLLFFLVDNQSLVLVESSAEVLEGQKVVAEYNKEAYVVEGLPEQVDVILIGKQADLYLAKQLSTKNVTVDLAGLGVGTHTVNLKYKNDVSRIRYELAPSTANITIYPKLSESRLVSVDVINQDKLNTKLSVQSVEIDNKEIIIKGAEHILEKVATVKALVDVGNLNDPEVGISTINDVSLVAYDNKGQLVDVEMVPNKITATVSIVSPNKEVPLKIIPVGNVVFGKAISSITSSVTKVTVYGDQATIDNIQFIPVKVDVTDLNSAKTFSVILEKPSGIRYISEISTTVNVSLDEEETKEISDVMIEFVNLDSNYKVVALDNASNKTTVIVKGTKSVLSTITDSSSIKATIDLAGLSVGEHEVEVMVSGTEVKASYTPKTTKVKVRIINK